MALNLVNSNFILLPGLVPEDISPFLSFAESSKDYFNLVIVTEQSCLSNLDSLSDFPNVFIYSLSSSEQFRVQQEQAHDVRLYQWYKYNLCLKILSDLETTHSFISNRVFKLRFDYIFTDPDSLLTELLSPKCLVDDFLFCDSDRVFFGSRSTMFSLRHFLDVAVALFLNKPDYYYPIHHGNLNKTALNVTRWERLNFDRRVFDCPSLQHLFTDPSFVQELISSTVSPPTPPTPSDIYSFHTGNRILPAERSFAWYLNTHGIIARHHPSMSGGIYRC